MDKLAQIGERAKTLLYDMRAEEAVEMLLSASAYVNEESSLAEKELVDWYAFYALAVKEARLPQEITQLERDYLDTSLAELDDIQLKLDEHLQKLTSWFSKIDALRSPPKINRAIKNPRSTAAQNRLSELKTNLEKQLSLGLSEAEWESTVTLIEEQLKYVVGWRVYSGSGGLIWTTVKPGHYSDYVKLLLDKKGFESIVDDIKHLVSKAVDIEGKREKIQCKFLSYSNKSSSIGVEIDRVVNNFNGA